MIGFEDVIIRLEGLNYNISEGDEITLEGAMREAENYIKIFCNIKEIPKELNDIWADMAAGIFLKNKIAVGENVCEGIDFEGEGIKTITEGDVSVTYTDDSGALAKYDKLIEGLCNKDDILVSYRRLRW
ncbi:MAG: hypothetical protein Q4F63_02885 [Clostridia bacterium]|nr:hypothetical protein [Clostridia bacterium]